MIRLLAIDIDGTLLDSRGRIPDAHRQALGDASARGVAIALVTGRSFHFTRPIADLLPMPVTLIVNNGAMVKSGEGVTLLRRLLPRDAALAVLAGTRAFRQRGDCVRPRDDGKSCSSSWTGRIPTGAGTKNKAFIAATYAGRGLTEDLRR